MYSSEVGTLFFEAHLILDIKTTFRLQKHIIAKTFDGNTFKVKAGSPV